MRIVALLVLLCSALLVIAVGVSVYGLAVHDPLDPLDQLIAIVVAVASFAFLAVQLREWRGARRRGVPGKLVTGVASMVPVLAAVGALSGALFTGVLIWSHRGLEDRAARALCREVLGPHGEQRPDCNAAARRCRHELAQHAPPRREGAERPEAACVRRALGQPAAGSPPAP